MTVRDLYLFCFLYELLCEQVCTQCPQPAPANGYLDQTCSAVCTQGFFGVDLSTNQAQCVLCSQLHAAVSNGQWQDGQAECSLLCDIGYKVQSQQ